MKEAEKDKDRWDQRDPSVSLQCESDSASGLWPGKARSRYWSGSEAPPAPFGQKGWQKKGRRRKRLGGRPGRGLSGLISQALGTRMDNTVLRHHHTESVTATAFDLFVFWNLCLCNKRWQNMCEWKGVSSVWGEINSEGDQPQDAALFACFDQVRACILPRWGDPCARGSYIHVHTRFNLKVGLYYRDDRVEFLKTCSFEVCISEKLFGSSSPFHISFLNQHSLKKCIQAV